MTLKSVDFLDSTISKFLSLFTSTCSYVESVVRESRRVVSFNVIECYLRHVNIMRVELHGHVRFRDNVLAARYNATRCDCHVSVLNFQTYRLACLRAETVGNFGKKIQSKWLIYLFIRYELRDDKMISTDFSFPDIH